MKTPNVLPYEYVPYPMCLYHEDGRTMIVQNAAEHAAAGPGWAQSPAEHSNSVRAKAAQAKADAIAHIEDLRAQLAAAEAALAEHERVQELPPPVEPAPPTAETLPTDPATVDADAAAAAEADAAKVAEAAAAQEASDAELVYSTSAASLIEQVKESTPEELRRLREIEVDNPKGERVSVTRAIDKALEDAEER